MKEELRIIQELMEQLQDEMKYSDEDLDERLGRKKPELEPKVEMSGLSDDMESPEDELGEMDEMSLDEEAKPSPEEDLKRRLMKLRGRE